MKIKNLINYGIPSYILKVWEKNYSSCLLPVQEEAVRNYGILNCGEESAGLPRRFAPSNDKREDVRNDGAAGLPRRFAPRNDKREDARNDSDNLLVIAPNSSGKTFIGEMAAIAQVIHLQKIIYLVPLGALADEKYRHFKNLYSHCGTDIVISTRDRNEDDHHIISGIMMLR